MLRLAPCTVGLAQSDSGKGSGHALTTHVIKPADYVIDIHSGDGNESLCPSYCAYYAEAGGEDVIEESERSAIAYGLETIVQFAGSNNSVDEAIYTSAHAVTLGIPAVNVLRELDMI